MILQNVAHSDMKLTKKALVDIDEVIFPENSSMHIVRSVIEENKCAFNLIKPNYKNIAKINKLHDEGWYIAFFSYVIWTKVDMENYYEFMWERLERWGCKFDELSTSVKEDTQVYDLIIDNKSINKIGGDLVSTE